MSKAVVEWMANNSSREDIAAFKRAFDLGFEEGLKEGIRQHLRKAGSSKSDKKLAALAENRKKKVPVMTPGAIYQRARRAAKRNPKRVGENP